MVGTPCSVAGSIPAFSILCSCSPQGSGDTAEEKTGPVVPYRQIKPVIIVSIYLGLSTIFC